MHQLLIKNQISTDLLPQQLNCTTHFAYLLYSYRDYRNKVNMEVIHIQLKSVDKYKPSNENEIFSIVSAYFVCAFLFYKKRYIKNLVSSQKKMHSI